MVAAAVRPTPPPLPDGADGALRLVEHEGQVVRVRPEGGLQLVRLGHRVEFGGVSRTRYRIIISPAAARERLVRRGKAPDQLIVSIETS